MQTILLIISTILVTVGPITYAVSIARGKTKPHRMTRFILLFVLTLNFVSILAAHGNTGAKVFAGISFAQSAIIFLMSMWKGMGGTAKTDWICFGIAVLGIVGWKVTGDPIIGVWFSILADLAAYIPAFIKTWKYPHTESVWYYLFAGVAAFLSLIAYKIESASLFQIYIALCCLVMIGLIYRKDIMGRFS